MLLQNLGQSDGICDFIDFIASPVVGLGNLLVQRRHPGSDKLAFLCAEFLFQQQRESLCALNVMILGLRETIHIVVRVGVMRISVIIPKAEILENIVRNICVESVGA